MRARRADADAFLLAVRDYLTGFLTSTWSAAWIPLGFTTPSLKLPNTDGERCQILEKFENMRKMIGMNGVMPGFSYGGMPYADAEASLRLFAQQCLPELQSWKTPPLAMPALQGVG